MDGLSGEEYGHRDRLWESCAAFSFATKCARGLEKREKWPEKETETDINADKKNERCSS